MLTGGPRTADSRQQSLAESIRWSYRLLGDAERTVLQRLAVFRAPFTAEGARALAAGEGVEEHDVLPLLANLVEKSFVVIDERHDASRYRLLETILEYAGSQLAAQPEESQTTRDRHLLYVRRTAERFRSTVQGGVSQADWPGQLNADLADVSAAVHWASETGSANEALRLIGGMARLWYFRARGEDRRIIDAALAIDGGDAPW